MATKLANRVTGTFKTIKMRVRYLDLEGNPVRNTSGYALIRRTYIAPATIDMYFDDL